MSPLRASSIPTAKRKKKTRKSLLSSTRPVQLHSASSALISSTTGRAVIRNYHILHKRLSAAIACNDEATIRSIRQEINSLGGLKKYQDASFAGQGKERGGDTSSVLVTWLSSPENSRTKTGLRMLEVGALSVNNACARSKLFGGGIERIDLNSRHPKIKEQDFMKRPLPLAERDGFDIVSLSLVVNFVGDLKSRGDMLRRVSKYLRRQPNMSERAKKVQDAKADTAMGGGEKKVNGIDEKQLLPALFLVFPAPCIDNSRYLDEERLMAIMGTLGYSMVRRKRSSKLVYYLWHFNDVGNDDDLTQARATYPKEEVRKGKYRNNFAIVLK